MFHRAEDNGLKNIVSAFHSCIPVVMSSLLLRIRSCRNKENAPSLFSPLFFQMRVSLASPDAKVDDPEFSSSPFYVGQAPSSASASRSSLPPASERASEQATLTRARPHPPHTTAQQRRKQTGVRLKG